MNALLILIQRLIAHLRSIYHGDIISQVKQYNRRYRRAIWREMYRNMIWQVFNFYYGRS